ncbi:MAG: SecF protein [candidate division CPR3 bacterium GW2011_GWE2_35_7]|nr:MAG: SecF protein [candidate division CPR3 bacterium GW2011_GWE2_35_7]
MFDFMKYRFIYYIISGILVLTSIASLAMWQLQPSIDFTGGSLVEVKYESDLGKEKERQLIEDSFREKEIETFVIQQTGNSSWIIRVKPIDEIKKNEILTLLNEKAGVKILEQRFEVVGPTIGKEITNKTFMAIILGISCILIYIAWTERKVSSKIASWKFGLAAIIALLHDSIITIGVFSLLGHFLNVEVDLLFVTAVLTIMSFSVHDTIVVFDRIKESFRKQSQLDLVTAVNISLTETITDKRFFTLSWLF